MFQLNRDANRCYRYLVFWGKMHHFVFIGDLRLRKLYDKFVQHSQMFATEEVEPPLPKDDAESSEFLDYKLKLRINFIRAENIIDMVDHFEKWQNEDHPPPMIVASATQSHLLQGNITKEMLDTYSQHLSQLLPAIDTLTRAKEIKLLWKLQDPIDEERLSEEWKNVQNDMLDSYNDEANTVLKYSGVQMWSSSKRIAEGLLDGTIDGWILSNLAAQHDIQILFNMYCNDYMNFNDGSCCSSAEPYTVVQVVTYAVLSLM